MCLINVIQRWSPSRHVRSTWSTISQRLSQPERTSLGRRGFHVSAISENKALPLTRPAAEETQDVTAMDQLLKVVRKRSNPAYHSMMPMRTPTLWSETLLHTAPKFPGQDLLSPSELTPAPDPGFVEPLTPRNMHDSYSELILPFSDTPLLLEQYTNASGGIRTGKLMEHLDSLAGSISYKHMLGPGVETFGLVQERGFYLVTASVDRLDMLAPSDPSRDLRLSGQVIYTGRSSMEVAVKMEAIGKDIPEETILIGRFSMVCRDANTHRARPVNPLVISTPEERALYTMGERSKARRKSLELRSLTRVPPTSSEAEVLHSFYLKYGQDNLDHAKEHGSVDRVWMGDTRSEKCLMMFPQERNIHQKIFGGYLMRLAYELGYTNASLFTRGPVHFLSLDGISFAEPVPIGCILRLSSYIFHSSSSEKFPALVHVGVKANVVDVKTGLERTTNNFRFTWCRQHGEPLRRIVVPKTYQEAMFWLEGKRALEMGGKIRELRTGKHVAH